MSNALGFYLYSNLPVSVQNVIFSVAGLQLKKKRYDSYFYQKLDEFISSDLDSNHLVDEKNHKNLDYILKYASKNVPFYLHNERILNTKDISCPYERLKNFPIMDKQKIRKNWSSFLSGDYPEHLRSYGYTSGTTGTAFKIAYDKYTQRTQWAIWWRQRSRYGIKPTDPFINFAGRNIVPLDQKENPIWRVNVAMRQTYVSVHHLSSNTLPGLLNYLNSRTVKYFSGYPAALNVVAEYMLKNNIQLQNNPKYIFTGAESLLDYQRKNLQEAFGALVVDQYGATEHCCNISECPSGNYHIDSEFGYVELLPIDGLDDQYREIIATGFNNHAMPLIRYRTGDIAKIKHQDCNCGRAGPVIERIDGRIEGTIKTTLGRFVTRLDFLFKKTSEIKEAQIIQKSNCLIVVKMVLEDSRTLPDLIHLTNELESYIGKDMKYNFEYVSEIPRTKSGKFRQIVSLCET